MYIKCENCNQFVPKNDKFCKYCGAPVVNEKEEKETKDALTRADRRRIDDEIQFNKTYITEEEIKNIEYFNNENLALVQKGRLESLRKKFILWIVFCVVSFVVCMVGQFLLQKVKGNIVLKVIVLWTINILLFLFLAIILEKAYAIVALNLLKQDDFTIRKIGLVKKPQIVYAGMVFDVDVTDRECPICNGEIKGRLDIEKIGDNFVVVCNVDRKHFWKIDVKDFLDKYFHKSEYKDGGSVQKELFCDDEKTNN